MRYLFLFAIIIVGCLFGVEGKKVGSRFLVVVSGELDIAYGVLKNSISGFEIPYDVIFTTDNGSAVPYNLQLESAVDVGAYQAVFMSSPGVFYADNVLGWTGSVNETVMNMIESYLASYDARIIYMNSEPSFVSGVVLMPEYVTYPYTDAMYATVSDYGRQFAQGQYGNMILNTSKLGPISIKPGAIVDPGSSTIKSLMDVSFDAAGAGKEYCLAVEVKKDGFKELHLFYEQMYWYGFPFYIIQIWIQWGAKNLYYGTRHMYLNLQVDDTMAYTAVWDPVNNVRSSLNKFKVEGWHMDIFTSNISSYSNELPEGSSFMVETAFNGRDCDENYDGYSICKWSQDNVDKLFWVSHTYTHINLDTASYATAKDEVEENRSFMASFFGPEDKTWVSYETMVTPEISGLFTGTSLQAIWEGDITAIMGDTSIPDTLNKENSYLAVYSTVALNGFDGMMIIPRFPTNAYYDCTTAFENEDEYNFIYSEQLGYNRTWEDILEYDAYLTVRALSQGRHDAYMFHQNNFKPYNYTNPWRPDEGVVVESVLGAWINRTFEFYMEIFDLPILSEKMDDIATEYRTREIRVLDCYPQVYLIFNDTHVTDIELSSAQDCLLPVTNFEIDPGHANVHLVEQYGSDLTTWINTTTVPVTIPLVRALPRNLTTFSHSSDPFQSTFTGDLVDEDLMTAGTSFNGTLNVLDRLGEAPLTSDSVNAKVEGPGEAVITVTAVDVSTYVIDFKTNTSGTYKIYPTINGQKMKEPTQITVIGTAALPDKSKVEVDLSKRYTDLNEGTISVYISLKDQYDNLVAYTSGSITASATDILGPVPNLEVYGTPQQGIFELRASPRVLGSVVVDVGLNGQTLANSPFSAFVGGSRITEVELTPSTRISAGNLEIAMTSENMNAVAPHGKEKISCVFTPVRMAAGVSLPFEEYVSPVTLANSTTLMCMSPPFIPGLLDIGIVVNGVSALGMGVLLGYEGCAPGQYAPRYNESCALCSPGTYSSESGSSKCTPCAVGYYESTPGASSCLSCGDPTTVSTWKNESDSIADCLCLPHYYPAKVVAGSGLVDCEPCPEGAACLGGYSLPVAAEGYFPNPEAKLLVQPGYDPVLFTRKLAFLKCINEGSCKLNVPDGTIWDGVNRVSNSSVAADHINSDGALSVTGKCKGHNIGLFCADCDDDYFFTRDEGSCEECVALEKYLVPLASVAFGIFTAVILFFRKQMSHFLISLIILFQYVHILHIFPIGLPAVVLRTIRYISVFFNFEPYTLECFVKDYNVRVFVQAAFSTTFFAVMALGGSYFARHNRRKARLVRNIQMFALVTFIPLSELAISLLDCRELSDGETKVLAHFSAVRCGADTTVTWIGAALFVFLVVIVLTTMVAARMSDKRAAKKRADKGMLPVKTRRKTLSVNWVCSIILSAQLYLASTFIQETGVTVAACALISSVSLVNVRSLQGWNLVYPVVVHATAIALVFSYLNAIMNDFKQETGLFLYFGVASILAALMIIFFIYYEKYEKKKRISLIKAVSMLNLGGANNENVAGTKGQNRRMEVGKEEPPAEILIDLMGTGATSSTTDEDEEGGNSSSGESDEDTLSIISHASKPSRGSSLASSALSSRHSKRAEKIKAIQQNALAIIAEGGETALREDDESSGEEEEEKSLNYEEPAAPPPEEEVKRERTPELPEILKQRVHKSRVFNIGGDEDTSDVEEEEPPTEQPTEKVAEKIVEKSRDSSEDLGPRRHPEERVDVRGLRNAESRNASGGEIRKGSRNTQIAGKLFSSDADLLKKSKDDPPAPGKESPKLRRPGRKVISGRFNRINLDELSEKARMIQQSASAVTFDTSKLGNLSFNPEDDPLSDARNEVVDVREKLHNAEELTEEILSSTRLSEITKTVVTLQSLAQGRTGQQDRKLRITLEQLQQLIDDDSPDEIRAIHDELSKHMDIDDLFNGECRLWKTYGEIFSSDLDNDLARFRETLAKHEADAPPRPRGRAPTHAEESLIKYRRLVHQADDQLKRLKEEIVSCIDKIGYDASALDMNTAKYPDIIVYFNVFVDFCHKLVAIKGRS